MALMIIAPELEVEMFAEELKRLEPDLDIRLWPQFGSPDDIEFMMAGTLFRLKEAGCEIHYMNVANGCCGTDRHEIDEIGEIGVGVGFSPDCAALVTTARKPTLTPISVYA